MCGIVGFVSSGNQTDRYDRSKFFSQALFADTLRGQGGTGVATIDSDNDISVFKKGLSAPDFLQLGVGELALRAVETARVTIGHNRAATIGSVMDKHAHPFHFSATQEIVLVHNGTLSSYSSLSPTGFTHSVDSAHVAIAMASTDDELSVLKKIKGSFVLVWYNKTKRTFNVARNENRDIWYKISDDGTLYFGSEMLMLDWILSRNGIKLSKREYKNFSQDCWYEWKFDDKWGWGKPTTRKIQYEKEKDYYDTRGESPYPLWGDEYGKSWLPPRKDYLPKHQNGSSGSPSNYENTVLEKFKLRKRDLVFVDVDAYEAYKHGDRGALVGEVVGWYQNENVPPNMELWVHGVPRDQWAKILKDRMRFYLPCRVSTHTRYTSTQGAKHIQLVGEIDWQEYNSMSGDPGKYLEDRKATIDEIAFAVVPPKGKEEGDDEMVPGPGNVLIPRSFWDELTAEGCVWCGNGIVPENFDKVGWTLPNASGGESAPLCQQCAASTAVEKELKDLAIYIPEEGKKAV